MGAVRLRATPREMVWGSHSLAPVYPDDPQRKIGEVWLEHEPPLPLLFKFRFTTQKLSVQVHPDDARAKEWENGSRGKTEMWRIIRADPGATIALGFQDELTRDQAHEAAISGEIEKMLRWIEVKPGEMYFVPAGTVHAIGAGIALCEVQQNSNVTYRLYDYGRPRELHLDKGLEVADLGPYLGGAVTGVQCEHFGVEELSLRGSLSYSGGRTGRVLLTLNGEGTLNGEPARPGEGWWIPGGERVSIEAADGLDVLEVRQP